VSRANPLSNLPKKECGCHVIEGHLTLTDLREASEAFCGTGAVITPVGCVSIMDQNGKEEASRITFGDGTTGPLTQKLYKMLTDIQSGSDPALSEKYKAWIHVVEP
jgi:branched-chain amino acid aminotransferase